MFSLLVLVINVGEMRQQSRIVELPTATLRGAEPTLSYTFEVQAGEAATMLTFELDVPEIIDSKKSVVTVLVDDRALKTVWLSRRNGEEHLSLQTRVPRLAIGFHTVTLLARLHAVEDRCGQWAADHLWLGLNRGTVNLIHELTSAPAQRPPELPATITEWMQWRARSLRVTADFEATNVVRVARLNAHSLIRESMRPLDPKGDVLDLILAKQCSQDTEAHLGHVHLEGKQLLLSTCDEADLSPLIAALFDPTTVGVCGRQTDCTLRASTPLQSRTETREKNETLVATRLANAGWPSGFVASGLGTHSFRWLWHKPVHWRVHGLPLVELMASIPEAWTTEVRARVQVDWNGQPLDTFLLQGGMHERSLKTRLPDSAASAGEWLLNVTIRIEPTDDFKCDHPLPQGLWVKLDASSSLRVERDEIDDGSIGALTSRWQDLGKVSVGENMSDSALRHSALALSTIHRRKAFALWRAAESEDSADIKVVSTTSVFIGQTLLQTPFALTRRAETPDRLVVYVPQDDNNDARCPEPELLTTAMAAMVCDLGQWLELKEQRITEVIRATVPAPVEPERVRLAAEREKWSQRVNMTFLALCTLGAVALALWLKRARAIKTARKIEVGGTHK